MRIFSLTNTARYVIPKLSFFKIAEGILSRNYDLSVVFISPTEMQKLNRTYRKKDASTDILAFPLSKTNGELYLSMPDVKRKSSEFGLSTRGYLAYLFVHGCLHLKGYDHGKRMEALERRHCRSLQLSHPDDKL